MVDEFHGQPWQPVIVAVRPAIFDGDVLAFDEAPIAQALTECGQEMHRIGGRPRAHEPDHRHRRLLRARRERPRSRRPPSSVMNSRRS